MMIKARSGCCCCSGWIECAVMALASPVQRSRLVGGKFVVWLLERLSGGSAAVLSIFQLDGSARITPERLWMV